MKLARGPRPASIHLFAAVLLTLAIANLATALWDLPAQENFLRSFGLGLEWNRDWTIITSSAWFTIELIPIALVWLAASRFARGFISVLAAIKLVLLLWNLPVLYALPGMAFGQLVALSAVALLYTRAANHWFAKREVDAEVFS